MPQGQEFIRHEFDEAIAIHQTLVEAERTLASEHPDDEGKRLMKSAAGEDEKLLKQLQQFGKEFGAEGREEEIAGGLGQLARSTAQKAGSDISEAYEAEAVVINLKRKQQDSGQSIQQLAKQLKNREMQTAAREFSRAQKRSADELTKHLGQLAVQIASS